MEAGEEERSEPHPRRKVKSNLNKCSQGRQKKKRSRLKKQQVQRLRGERKHST
jgi:hypothetical protein